MKKNFLYVLFALVTLTLSLPLRAQMRIYSNNIQIAKKSANMFFNTDGKGNWSVVDAKSGAYNANMDVSRIDSISVVDNVIHVTGITLAPSKVQLNEGGRAQITATILPKNATYQSITFKTSDPGVVAIKGDSLFAVSPGTATITATTAGDGTFTATCTVEVDISIPDTEFYKYCMSQFDEDKNGGLSVEEAAAATKINCTKLDIKSTKGLEWFTNLTELYIQYAWNLTTIDVSKNTALTKLTILNGGLESLNVRMLKKLTYLACAGTKITSLNVSENTELTNLQCNVDKLSLLNVSNNPKLTRLVCSDNMLLMLDLSHNTALSNLLCYNNRIASLDLSNNKALTSAMVGNQTDPWGNGQYVDINVIVPSGMNTSSVFAFLNYGADDPQDYEYGNNRINFTSFINIPDATFRAYCVSNFDTNKDGKITLSEAAAAQTINVGSTDVASLEGIQYFTNITFLDCTNCKLEGTLDVSMLKKMIYCQCSRNKITKLILPENGAVGRLQCFSNRISSLELQRCSKLTVAFVGGQTSDGTTGIYINVYLEDAFTSGISDDVFPKLNDADGYNTRVAIPVIFRDDNFEAYCVSHFDTNKDGILSREEAKTVTNISCAGSKIKDLEGIKWFTNLEQLNVGNNNISFLILNGLKALKSVSASYMPSLTNVFANGCSALTDLYVYGGGVSGMNLTGCSALKNLYCWGNRLNSLDLNGVNALTTAYVGAQTSDGITPQVITLVSTNLPESVFPDFGIAGYGNTFVVFDGRFVPFSNNYGSGLLLYLTGNGYDKDGDGKISYNEASQVESLNSTTYEMFENASDCFKYLCCLKVLVCRDKDVAKHVPFPGEKIIQGVSTFDMGGFALDLSCNPVLKTITLNGSSILVKDVYKSLNTDLTVTLGLYKLLLPKSTQYLDCSDNNICIGMNVQDCPNLKSIKCGENFVGLLHFENCKDLEYALIFDQHKYLLSEMKTESQIKTWWEMDIYTPKGWSQEKVDSVFKHPSYEYFTKQESNNHYHLTN
jgi:hypothetical protein